MNDKRRPEAAPSDGLNVDSIVQELASFHAAGLRVMLDTRLTTAGRTAAMMRLLRRARSSSLPEFATRGVERALFDVVFGADPEQELRDRWLAEAITRAA